MKNIISKIGIILVMALSFTVSAQSSKTESVEDTRLLDSFISQKQNAISFSHSNIKQYWTSNNIVSQNDSIKIVMSHLTKGYESIPLPIQLAHVDASLDCIVEVYSGSQDISFSIMDSKLKSIATSSRDESFISYSVNKALFHLEDTNDFLLNIKFSSSNSDILDIKRIVLSFDDNKEFHSSPGSIKLSSERLKILNASVNPVNSDSFSLTGVKSRIFSNEKILVSDNTITSSVTVKNTGKASAHIYFGFTPYTKDGIHIENRHAPYKNVNKILRVLSSEKGENKIVVDSYSDWTKGCYLVLNAKEDLSDFPNSNFVDGKIQNVNVIDDSHVEIIFDKPIAKEIKKGTCVRIQAPNGAGQMYTYSKDLSPGEEVTISSPRKKDDSLFQFPSKVFCHGCYYVIPFLFSYSLNPNEENTVLLTNFGVEY